MVIRTIHRPVATAVVDQIRTAYSNVLPGLPYLELPVVSITSVFQSCCGLLYAF